MAERLRIRVHYRTDDKDPDTVVLGGFAQIATKRKFGLAGIKSQDPEVLMFGVFVELHGPAGAKDPEAFDDWLVTVDYWEAVRSDGTTIADDDPDDEPEDDDDEDPPVAVIPSDSSPGSPPTSE